MHVDRAMSRPLSGCNQKQHVDVGTRFESLAAAGEARQQVVCTVVVYVPPKHMWCVAVLCSLLQKHTRSISRVGPGKRQTQRHAHSQPNTSPTC